MSLNARFHKTSFLTSANALDQLPLHESREVAFAGRSNAGKSSALNLITAQKTLARTSKTPGRTQLINYFKIDDNNYLVDLPGYGYAKVPERIRLHWQQILQGYFETRENLIGLVMLMDVRHPMTDLDEQMLHWCELKNLPTHILLTKADKLKRGPAQAALLSLKKALESYTMPVTCQLFSASDPKVGLKEIHTKLNEWLPEG